MSIVMYRPRGRRHDAPATRPAPSRACEANATLMRERLRWRTGGPIAPFPPEPAGWRREGALLTAAGTDVASGTVAALPHPGALAAHDGMRDVTVERPAGTFPFLALGLDFVIARHIRRVRVTPIASQIGFGDESRRQD